VGGVFDKSGAAFDECFFGWGWHPFRVREIGVFGSGGVAVLTTGYRLSSLRDEGGVEGVLVCDGADVGVDRDDSVAIAARTE
jgi:hypothetical protein